MFDVTLFILKSFRLILSLDERGLLLGVLNVMYLVFLVFKANLFAGSQESTFCNCSFTFLCSLRYESTLRNKFVSSANLLIRKNG